MGWRDGVALAVYWRLSAWAKPMTVDRIGERLRRYRRAANKTLNQVAKESGLTASFLSQAERNLTGVSISSLANIAKSLGVPLNSLFDQPTQAQPDSHQGERVRYTIEGQPLAYERLSTSFPGESAECREGQHAGGLSVRTDRP